MLDEAKRLGTTGGLIFWINAIKQATHFISTATEPLLALSALDELAVGNVLPRCFIINCKRIALWHDKVAQWFGCVKLCCGGQQSSCKCWHDVRCRGETRSFPVLL
jgi:hypothetical protein